MTAEILTSLALKQYTIQKWMGGMWLEHVDTVELGTGLEHGGGVGVWMYGVGMELDMSMVLSCEWMG